MKPVCSVVIRVYNEEKHIGRLLTGISHQTIGDIQVILVDSGSTDDTLAIASQYSVKVVHIRPDEFTFGRSLNRGIASAQAELVVIASGHVYPVYPDWLERLLAPFKDPQVALTYGKQRGASTTQFSEHQIFQHWFPDQSQLQQEYPFCNNANAAVRRALWEKHAYDETLAGLEDLDWAKWAHKKGYIIAYVSDAEIIHVHNETWRDIYNRYRREGMAFKALYPQETFNLSNLFNLWVGNVSNDLRAASEKGVLWANLGSILRFRWMQFWGTYQGYRQSGSLTWKLKKAFYYPRSNINQSKSDQREVEPIQYHDHSEHEVDH